MHSKSPMFQESKVYKPFHYPWAVELTEAHERIHWVSSEVTLEEDISDWGRNKVTECEKQFITQVLRLFTQSDVSVGNYYHNKFIPQIKNNELRNLLASCANRESEHQRAYALLSDSLGLPEGDYAAFLEYKEMSDKIAFMEEANTTTQHGFGLALAKAVFNEGITLFGSFIMLLNFQRRGLLKGLGTIIRWSIRDEGIHLEAVSKLFKVFCEEHKTVPTDAFKKEIYNMAKRAIQLEDKFIDLAYKDCQIEGLTSDEVKTYLRYLMDRRLLQLGLKGIFKIKVNPLPWVETIINAPSHDNFFETRVVDYEIGNLCGSWSYD